MAENARICVLKFSVGTVIVCGQFCTGAILNAGCTSVQGVEGMTRNTSPMLVATGAILFGNDLPPSGELMTNW